MTNTPTESARALRQRAEEKFRAKEAATPDTLSPEETKQLLHELRVHQIELEMQNEELRRTQHELEDSRTRYFDLYDLAPVGYLTISAKGLIQEANLAVATMLGVVRSALVKQPLSRNILKEDQDIYYLHRKQLLKSGEPQACELRMEKSDGMAFWAHLTISTEQDPSTSSGQATGGAPVFRVVLSDISERKKAEQELELLYKYLEARVVEMVADLRSKDQTIIQQNRLAAMGEMIGNIAHQWRQPLNNVALIIQKMQMDFDFGTLTSEEMHRDIEEAMEVIRQMSHTIDDFRNFFRIDKEKNGFLISAAVDRAMSLVSATLKSHNIQVEINTDDDVTVIGFQNEYSQVLLNLFSNSSDACNGRCVADPRIFIRITRENERSVLYFRDSCGGIPDDVILKIFDPYFTTRGPDKGTGIGLYMSKMIIEQNMDGHLTASNVDGGAEFRIEV